MQEKAARLRGRKVGRGLDARSVNTLVAKYGYALVRTAVDEAAGNKRLDNAGGWVVNALANGFEPAPTPVGIKAPDYSAEHSAADRALAAYQETVRKKREAALGKR